MIEKIEKTKINSFRIKDDVLKKVETVYKFSVYKDFLEYKDKSISIYGLAYKNNAIVLKDGEFDVVSYTKPNDREYVVLKFSDLHEEHRKKLLNLYITKNFIDKVNYEIGKNFTQLSDGIFLRKKLDTLIEKIGEDFYLIVDIKHSIDTEKNLWDYCNRDLNELISFKENGGRVRGSKGKGSAIIKEIIPYGSQEYDKYKKEIILYYEDKGEKLNLVDSKQPVVKVAFNDSKTIYPYLTELLYPVITVEELSDVNSFLRKTRISNVKRSNSLISIIKTHLNEVLDFNPMHCKSFVFNVLKLKSKSVYNKIETYESFGDYVKGNFRNLNGKVSIFNVPSILEGKVIPTFFILDNKLKGIIRSELEKNPLRDLRDSLSKVSNSNKTYPKFENYSAFSKLYFHDLNDILGLVDKINKTLQEKNYDDDKVLPLVITVGKEEDMNSKTDYYLNLKRILLQKGFIHQHIIYEHINSNYGKVSNLNFEIDNLIVQILVKYGIYPYVPDVVLEYDYIIGVDVGNDRYGDRKVGGAVSVFNKNGFFETILPIYINTGGEKVDLGRILETVQLNLCDLKDKKILLLRDGILYNSEVQNALDIITKLNLKITFMNVVKKHNLRILEDYDERKGVILKDNLALLLNHSFEGARPIKITLKKVIENGEIRDEKITENDLWHLYVLSYVNYTNIYLKSKRFKYPAPIHYADKFVKSLGKELRIREDLLKYGYLYFL